MSPLALSLRFLQTQSDAQLATLARAGHERAFEALVRRYRRPLLAYCRRIGSSGVNPEDTLQQALLQAWTAIRTGVEVRDPRAWLYRIVHNVAVSNQRRPVLVPVELQDTAGANGADHEAEQRMAARAALAGLAALPQLQREVMVGTAVDGLSHEELASALGLSSGAVRGLIYRARATLRAAAAAVLPAPVIGWALRSGSGRASGVVEALGGGGSAGLGGILLKGGVIAATAGAIATAGISTNPRAGHHGATQASVGAVQHARTQAAAAAGTPRTVLVSEPFRASGTTVGERPPGVSQRSGSRDSGGRGSDRSSAGFVAKRGSDGGRESASSGGGDHHDGTGHGSGHDASGPGPSDGSTSGGGDRSPGGGSGDSGGHGSDGSASVVSGSDGGSSGSGGSGSGGSSGSGSGSGSGGSGSHDGGGSGSDGGGSATAGSTPLTTATPDDGSDGSGHDGGSTTSTTTTVTTLPVPTTVDDGGGSGHQHGN